MIFVLSDTHIPERMVKLPQKLLNQIKPDDIILHVDDFVRWEVFQKLKSLATIHAVCGNMDDGKIKEFLPQRRVVEVQGKKIGLCHGYGSPFKLAQRIYGEFKERCDVLIFGHSHVSYNRKI